MSNMNGFDLYLEIMKIDEKVKVCFITAFDVDLKQKLESSLNEASPLQYGQKNPICFIQKPIEIDELIKRIKEELAS
jgi:two-component SAPR family response regulator